MSDNPRIHPRAAAVKLLLALTALLLCIPAAKAQTDIQLSQYWAVPAYYNPGATGTSDFVKIRGGARMQWLGIHNAPKGFLVSADSPLKIGKKRIGLGVNMMQESIGLFSNMAVNLQASYKLRLFGGTLSIGLQGGYFNQKFKGSEIVTPGGDDYHDPSDEALPTQDLNGGAFDLSAGLHYEVGKFWFGVSGLHLLQPTITMTLEGSENSDTKEYESQVGRMVYFMGGGNFPIKNTLFELQPSFLVKSDFNMFTAEVSARARYNKFLSFGVGYRWKDAVTVMAGAEFKNFFLGYAYDYPVSAIGKASSGSHEIIAGYQLKLDFSGKNRNKHRSIRIM